MKVDGYRPPRRPRHVQHYCDGGWKQGKRVDCDKTEHNVRLQRGGTDGK